MDSQFTTTVAQAQPTAPRPSSPSPPKANQTDSGIFTSSEPVCSQVTSSGLPRLWLRVLYMRNSRAAGRASTSTDRYSRTSFCKAGGTCVHSSSGPGKNSAVTPTTMVRPER